MATVPSTVVHATLDGQRYVRWPFLGGEASRTTQLWREKPAATPCAYYSSVACTHTHNCPHRRCSLYVLHTRECALPQEMLSWSSLAICWGQNRCRSCRSSTKILWAPPGSRCPLAGSTRSRPWTFCARRGSIKRSVARGVTATSACCAARRGRRSRRSPRTSPRTSPRSPRQRHHRRALASHPASRPRLSPSPRA